MAQKPNIILIISDALRARDLSVYGYSEENDANIKRIASESLVFENNFSASTASDPSITSMFSAKYPWNHGFVHQHPFTNPEEIEKLKKNKFWLPIYLQKEGYFTLSATPMYTWFKKGFDSYKNKEIAKGGKILDLPFIKRILLHLPNWAYRLGKMLVKTRASPHFFPAKEAVDFAISEISKTEKPFFLFMHLVETHYPYPAVRLQKIDGLNSLNKVLNTIKTPSQKEYIKKRFYDISANYLEEIETARDESIKIVDGQINRLSKFLKQKNLWENTIFIITSDHGDNFGEHNTYFCRGGLYDSSIHTPLIMRIPGISGRRIRDISQNTDIAPTILEILGKKEKGLDGKALLATAKRGKSPRKTAFSSDGFCQKATVAITKSKKLIISDGSKCLLCGAVHFKALKEEYNLQKDSEETENIYSGKDELESEIESI